MLKGRVLHPLHPPASPTPLINNNHLYDHQNDASIGTIETLLSPSEEIFITTHCVKNSNQLAACVTTPLQPYQGRNPCLERNLLTGSTDSLLIDKSSKHCGGNTIPTNSSAESHIPLVTNDFLNFQINHRAMPIPYLQNAVHGGPKQQNNNQNNNNGMMISSSTSSNNNISRNKSNNNKFKWNSIMRLFNHQKKLLLVTPPPPTTTMNGLCCKETQVKLNSTKNMMVNNNYGQNSVTTSLLLLENHDNKRPSTLPLSTLIVDDKPSSDNNNLLINSSSGITQIINRKNSLTRQHSLEQFNEVFSSTSDLSHLKDPSQRIKTPGDVPASVRRQRGKAARNSVTARFSLYDDRMMMSRSGTVGGGGGQWGSAPDLEPLKPPQLNDIQDRDSVSSF